MRAVSTAGVLQNRGRPDQPGRMVSVLRCKIDLSRQLDRKKAGGSVANAEGILWSHDQRKQNGRGRFRMGAAQ